jgi:hypothetical protein
VSAEYTHKALTPSVSPRDVTPTEIRNHEQVPSGKGTLRVSRHPSTGVSRDTHLLWGFQTPIYWVWFPGTRLLGGSRHPSTRGFQGFQAPIDSIYSGVSGRFSRHPSTIGGSRGFQTPIYSGVSDRESRHPPTPTDSPGESRRSRHPPGNPEGNPDAHRLTGESRHPPTHRGNPDTHRGNPDTWDRSRIRQRFRSFGGQRSGFLFPARR